MYFDRVALKPWAKWGRLWNHRTEFVLMAADIFTTAPRTDKVTGQIIQQKMLTWSFGLASHTWTNLSCSNKDLRLWVSFGDINLVSYMCRRSCCKLQGRRIVRGTDIILCISPLHFCIMVKKTLGIHGARAFLGSLWVDRVLLYALVCNRGPFIDTLAPLMLARPQLQQLAFAQVFRHIPSIWSLHGPLLKCRNATANAGCFGTVN